MGVETPFMKKASHLGIVLPIIGIEMNIANNTRKLFLAI